VALVKEQLAHCPAFNIVRCEGVTASSCFDGVTAPTQTLIDKAELWCTPPTPPPLVLDNQPPRSTSPTLSPLLLFVTCHNDAGEKLQMLELTEDGGTGTVDPDVLDGMEWALSDGRSDVR
jgi:hypothetical protein